MTNLAGIVRDEESARGEWLAMRQGELALTYAELARANGQAAALLREVGVGPGGRVALMLPNVLAFPVFFYGSLAVGAAVVPMNPLLKSREVAYYLGDSGASVIFAWEPMADEAAKGAADTGAQVIRVAEPDARTFSATGSRWLTGRNAATTTTQSSCTPPGRPASRRAPK